MKKAKVSFVILLIVIVSMMSGCVRDLSATGVMWERVCTFGVEGKVRMVMPEQWKDVTNGLSYDLQCTNGICNLSAYTYDKESISKNDTPKSIYKQQNDLLFEGSKAKKVVKTYNEIKTSDKVIFSELYSAKKNDKQNYYYCSLVEFKKDSNIFMWICFNGTKKYITTHLSDFDRILESAELPA